MDIPGTSGDSSYQQWAHVIECPICYSVYDKPMQMGCGHTLCVNCIVTLVNQVKNNAQNAHGNLPPQMPRVQMDENGFIGLGGNNDLDEAAQWLEIPQLDQRDPGHVRALIGFPARRRDNGSVEIKCPECRKPTMVPPEGLPINYRVQEIVQKVVPLFKDQHLVKKCNQCEAVLTQGVYFDCDECGDNGNMICSTCAIRSHNGHGLTEKKALTTEDVVKMKKMIDDASHRAFQAYENVKPRLETIGGVINLRVNEKMASLIKIFEFMISQFDSKIKETSTMDELMAEVKKAEKIADAYEVARERVEVMLNAIEAAFEAYWDPFQQIRIEMGYDEPNAPAPVDAAPAPPAPGPAANPNQIQIQNPDLNNALEMMQHLPEAAIRVFNNHLNRGPPNPRAAVAHFAQVDRQRNRVRVNVPPGMPPHMRGMPPGNPMWGQMGPQHGQGPMRPGPMGPGPIRQGPRIMAHPIQPPPIQHQQHQQQPQQQQGHPVFDFVHIQAAHLQRHHPNMGPMPNVNMVRMNNGGNMQNLQQLQQHVPMPPQMPNFPQQQQQQHQPQQQQQAQQRHPLPHAPMPPPNMAMLMNQNQGQGYHMRGPQQQPPPPPQPNFHNQGVHPEQLHQHLQHLQEMRHQQQQLLQQQEHQHHQMLQQQQQQEQQQQQQMQQIPQMAQLQQVQNMAQPPIPEPREDIPRDPNWDNIPADNNAPQFEMEFDNRVAAEQIEEEEIIDQNQEMVQQIVNQIGNQIGQVVENYRAGDINMIQFQEGNGIPIVPIEDNNQQNIIIVQNDGLGDDGLQEDDLQNNEEEQQEVDNEQDQFEDPEAVPEFVEFHEMRDEVDAIDANIQQAHIEHQVAALNQIHPVIDLEPVHPVIDLEPLDQFIPAAQVALNEQQEDVELVNRAVNANLAAEIVVQDVEEEIVLVEEEQPVPAVTRRSQRRELVQEAEMRRSVRRSLRNSNAPFDDLNPVTTSEASSSNGVAAQRSPSPYAITKRRKMDKKPKMEEPEEMEADEPVDPAPRAQKRRAATTVTSSSSAGPSSAPTTRSQTRS